MLLYQLIQIQNKIIKSKVNYWFTERSIELKIFIENKENKIGDQQINISDFKFYKIQQPSLSKYLKLETTSQKVRNQQHLINFMLNFPYRLVFTILLNWQIKKYQNHANLSFMPIMDSLNSFVIQNRNLIIYATFTSFVQNMIISKYQIHNRKNLTKVRLLYSYSAQMILLLLGVSAFQYALDKFNIQLQNFTKLSVKFFISFAVNRLTRCIFL